MGRNYIPGIGVAIDADTATSRGVVHLDSAWAGPKIVEWIFRIDSTLNGMPFDVHIALGHSERFSHCDKYLLFN